LHFADRDGVDPDTALQLREADSETLADPVPVATVDNAAEEPKGCNRDLQQVNEEIVEEAHRTRLV
jgi:hypothetical protein